MKKYKKYLYPLLAAFLVTLLVSLGVLKRVDKWVQDWICQRPRAVSSDIVIIGIDEEAFSVFGPYNTWDRNIVASALADFLDEPRLKPAAPERASTPPFSTLRTRAAHASR